MPIVCGDALSGRSLQLHHLIISVVHLSLPFSRGTLQQSTLPPPSSDESEEAGEADDDGVDDADEAQAAWTPTSNEEEEDDDGPITTRPTRASTRAVHGSGARGENETPNPKAGKEDSVMVAKPPGGKDPHFPISCLYSSSTFSNDA